MVPLHLEAGFRCFAEQLSSFHGVYVFGLLYFKYGLTYYLEIGDKTLEDDFRVIEYFSFYRER